MKKIFFVLIILFQFQWIVAQNFKMGLYISPSINWINFGDINSENSKSGFNYGYHIEYGLTENHFLTSGFEISHKGGENMYGEYKLHYFVLPLQVKMKSRPFGYFTYFAQVGPSIGVRIRDHYDNGDEGLIESDVEVEDSGKGKNIIMIINLSIGIEYSLRQETIVYSELFLKNNITNSWKNGENNIDSPAYGTFLVNQIGLSIGFLF